jgi:Mrp family chromosome partitioning ATPase
MHQPGEISAKQKAEARIIDSEMPDRYVFNAFRDLRTSIVQHVKEASPIIMVTSCARSGGGSFVALNLAAAISMDATKTSLLVDCNLGEPDVSRLAISTQAEKMAGLKDYLQSSDCSVQNIIYPSGIPRLRVIPAGFARIAKTEYFTSARLHRLFDEIKQRYAQRYIIVDAPPITSDADTRILAEVCDHVVLVVPYGRVTEDQVLKAARAIGKEKLLGTVFNNEPRFPRLAWR